MTRTLGQVAYEEYHHGPASRLIERSTVAPLPYSALSHDRKQVWEDVADRVKAAIEAQNNTVSSAP